MTSTKQTNPRFKVSYWHKGYGAETGDKRGLVHSIFTSKSRHDLESYLDAKGHVIHSLKPHTETSNIKEQFKAKLIESLNEDTYKVEHEGHPDAETRPDYSHLKPGKTYINHVTKYPDSAKKTAAMLKKNGFQGVKVYKNGKLTESLNEDTYKVEHEGHPDADKVKELSHLKPGKKYTNHITKYPDSAKKAAAMLKKNGFQGVKIYKNWSVMEGVDLDESIVSDAHDAKMKEMTKKGYKSHSLGHEGAPGVESHIMKHGETGEKIHVKTWRKSASEVGQKVVPVKEEVELDESRMSALHADIGDHMDEHIANYKRVGGAESLMAHAAKATPKIAKMHGIEHKHAEKFVSDYIDSKLNEEAELEEGLADKVSGFFYNAAAKKIVRVLDAGERPSAMAAHVATMSPSAKTRIKTAVGHYLKSNDHPKLKMFHSMLGEETLNELSLSSVSSFKHPSGGKVHLMKQLHTGSESIYHITHDDFKPSSGRHGGSWTSKTLHTGSEGEMRKKFASLNTVKEEMCSLDEMIKAKISSKLDTE